MWGRHPGLFRLPEAREGAEICIFGAPFDGTSSGHSGSRYAPSAIREAAEFLEVYSPLQDRDIDALPAIDVGDLDVPLGNTPRALAQIGAAVAQILEADQRPVMLGGEHLCSLPAVEAMLAKYPDLVVLQFDAHTDLRDTYLGESLSHATVMRRILERLDDPKSVVSYGLRSGLREEFQLAQRCRFCGPQDHNMHQRIAALRHHLDELKGRPIYLTFDLDVFDPSLMPGTGTPEPGGIFFDEFAHLLRFLPDYRFVGLDIVELCPPAEHSNISAILAAKVARELLFLLHQS